MTIESIRTALIELECSPPIIDELMADAEFVTMMVASPRHGETEREEIEYLKEGFRQLNSGQLTEEELDFLHQATQLLAKDTFAKN